MLLNYCQTFNTCNVYTYLIDLTREVHVSVQSIFELYDNVSYLNFIIIVVFTAYKIDGLINRK